MADRLREIEERLEEISECQGTHHEWLQLRAEMAGILRGVAETEAKYAPWEHLVGENNDLRQQLADTCFKGEALVAVLERVLPKVAVCPECGPIVTFDEDGCCTTCGSDIAIAVPIRAALDAYPASQPAKGRAMPSDWELTDEEVRQLRSQWFQGDYTWDWETHLVYAAARKMATWIHSIVSDTGGLSSPKQIESHRRVASFLEEVFINVGLAPWPDPEPMKEGD